MKYFVLKLCLAISIISLSITSCTKSEEIEPTKNPSIETTEPNDLEKKPAWAFFGVGIYFGEPTLNPHHDPEVPASNENPLTICLGQGFCKIEIGSSDNGNMAKAYPRKTEDDKLEFYFNRSKLNTTQLENFENDQIVVHEDIEVAGDWLTDLGFSEAEYTIESGVYSVSEIDKYLIVSF